MKNPQIISDAIGLIDEEMIESADRKRKISMQREGHGRFQRRTLLKFSLAAACAVLAAGIVLLMPRSISTTALAEAVYPGTAQYPDIESEIPDGEYDIWSQQERERRDSAGQISGNINAFYKKTAEQFLMGGENENKVYSPVNMYMALAMLAETTDKNSRSQILSLLGSDSMETQRAQANVLWNATYRNDGATTSILANSLWLNKNIRYDEKTVGTLAKNYFASVYRGDTASGEMTNALRRWISDQTGGLLKDAADAVSLDPQTVMSLCSTAYFSARWLAQFDPENNDTKTFHAPAGDIQTTFMNNTADHRFYYAGRDFGAISLSFANDGCMWFILPDGDKTIDDVIRSGEYLEMMRDPLAGEKCRFLRIHYSVPKFDVSSDQDLINGLAALGVTDVFDADRADFSPLAKNREEICVNAAKHSARVTIDEEGCTAAAFTVLTLDGAGIPPEEEMDFILDRPFLFVVMSDTRQPLFIGAVNNP